MADGWINLDIEGLGPGRVIGSGGSALVYRSSPIDDPDRAVAVKVLRHHWDPAARRRFERERRIMDRLADRGGFVPILETGETPGGSPYMVMPFYHRGSLQDRLRDHGPVDWPRAVRFVEQVAETLAEAHALDVYHRDIKPANILVTDNGETHVADFGIAQIVDETARATATAAFTPAYSPPESFLHGLQSVATTDVYGLAATLWALIAGHAPFKERGERVSPVAVLGRVMSRQVGDLRDRVPSPLCWFIETAMAKAAADRPQTMTGFLEALGEAREDAYRGVHREPRPFSPLEIDGIPLSPGSDLGVVTTADTLAAPVAGSGGGGSPDPGSAGIRSVGDHGPVPAATDSASAPVETEPGRPERVVKGWHLTPSARSDLVRMAVTAVITTTVLLIGWLIVVRLFGGGGADGLDRLQSLSGHPAGAVPTTGEPRSVSADDGGLAVAGADRASGFR